MRSISTITTSKTVNQRTSSCIQATKVSIFILFCFYDFNRQQFLNVSIPFVRHFGHSAAQYLVHGQPKQTDCVFELAQQHGNHSFGNLKFLFLEFMRFF